jgi:hypothetical protein
MTPKQQTEQILEHCRKVKEIKEEILRMHNNERWAEVDQLMDHVVTQLKPCPKCGGTDELSIEAYGWDGAQVMCGGCGFWDEPVESDYGTEIEKALKQWNEYKR